MPKFKEIRVKLEAAQKISTDLNQIADLDKSLVAQSQSNLINANEFTVSQKMVELSIENMRNAFETELQSLYSE